MEQTIWFVAILWTALGAIAAFTSRREFSAWLQLSWIIFMFILLPAAVIKVLIS